MAYMTLPSSVKRFRDLRQLLKLKLQVVVWMQSVFLGCFHHTIDSRACFRPSRRVGKQPVFTSNNERLDRALAAIVVHLQSSVCQISRQLLPLVQTMGTVPLCSENLAGETISQYQTGSFSHLA